MIPIQSFKTIQNDLQAIEQFITKQIGTSTQNNAEVHAELEKLDDTFFLKIGSVLNLDRDELKLDFVKTRNTLRVNGTVIKNEFTSKNKLMSRCSTVKVYSWTSLGFTDEGCFLRNYYTMFESRILRDFFEISTHMDLSVNGHLVRVDYQGNYLIIQSADRILPEAFTEVCYNILVGIGFVSGHFIQKSVFTFQYEDKDYQKQKGHKYQKLRPTTRSIYHALADNPYGYEDMIGSENAKRIYHEESLKRFDQNSLSKLAELAHNNPQVQYLMVLFNEANSNNLSLLVQNNCFFVVLEILKKFFFEESKSKLSSTYSRVGNVEKYKMVFGCIVSLNKRDCEVIKMRNTLLHGDVRNLEGSEMLDIMHSQITLIYKLILTYIGFNGYTIDHYALRNNLPDEAFVKVN